MVSGEAATWGIAGLATAGVIVRPAKLPEAIWAVGGAILIVLFGLLPIDEAWRGVVKGADVYFFLVGMMLLAEVARREGLFDWLAALATGWAKGSAVRLFGLVYGVGVVVTVFLSNDATAVVLTPAVFAAANAARVKDPMPYLFICAFIANAASFVLPISNPANLVVFGGGHMPPLMAWLGRFSLASLSSIVVTFLALYMTQRTILKGETVATYVPVPRLSSPGRLAGTGIVATALVLIAASAFDEDLGLPTAIAGLATSAAILIVKRETPWALAKEISWGVLPLVAGLFVLVEALAHTGVIAALVGALQEAASRSAVGAAWSSGILVAIVCNLINNLPAGLIAGATVQGAHASPTVASAIMIGVDLGPNLSVTGSLATILWLYALRREELSVGAWRFLRLGLLVAPPALIAALAAALLTG
jgi:arsenical pump membrane protein